MATLTPKDRLPHFIITTGLTRRLVEGRDAEDAIAKFKYDTPTRSVTLMSIAEDLEIHRATEDEVAEFQRSRKRGPSEDQIAWELGDVVLTPAQRKAKKEHA